MPKISGDFTIAIAGTKDLTPPDLVCHWEGEFDGEPDLEKALKTYFQTSYVSGLKKVMEAQTKNFAVPLVSMQKEIDEMAKDIAALDEIDSRAAWQKAVAAFKAKYKRSLPLQVDEYNKYLAKAVQNTRDQQMAIYAQKFEVEAMAAAQKAVKRDLRNKRIRIVAGVVLKGTLVLSVAAAGLAAAIISFGTVGVVFASLTAIGAGLSGATALGSTAKSIFEIRSLEKRSLGLLRDDIEEVTIQLGKAEGKVKGLSKRISDVSLHYTTRINKTTVAREEVKKLDAVVAKLRTEVDKLKTARLLKLHAKQNERLQAAEKALLATKAKFEAASRKEAELKAVLEKAQALVGDFDKIPFQGGKTVLGGLKSVIPSGADEVMDAVDTLSNVVGAIGFLGSSIAPTT